ncbi:AraC family transcriptional regulator [Streptomyces alanosinicus]|uniref:AraC family transcriptional regulator n=1 Tax=Streptomyces alanosinicus TaxID=68171 RepID=UPI001E2FEEF9|nr:helix-turn-helix domain-containing protein [Streptomyces alanosinicus]
MSTVSARPHPALRPGVISYRGIRLTLDRPRRRLETPIAAATLLLGFEAPVRITRAGRPPVSLVSVVNGLTAAPALGEHAGRLSGIEVLLAPWAAFTLFDTEQYELANRSLHPDELAGPAGVPLGELAAALAALPRRPERFALLDRALLERMRAGAPVSERVVHAWSPLGRSSGRLPVPRPAAEAGWSVRHLENRFREQIGLPPKAAARVLPVQRARRLLTAGHGQAETAALCGYYDQAHFSGELRTMTGCSPGEFLAGEATSLVLAPGHGALFSKTRGAGTGHAVHPAIELPGETGEDRGDGGDGSAGRLGPRSPQGDGARSAPLGRGRRAMRGSRRAGADAAGPARPRERTRAASTRRVGTPGAHLCVGHVTNAVFVSRMSRVRGLCVTPCRQALSSGHSVSFTGHRLGDRQRSARLPRRPPPAAAAARAGRCGS